MINGEFVIEWKKEKSTPIVLTVDEYETIRLLDKKGYSQSSNCSFGGCYKQEIYKNMQQALSFLAEFQEMRIKQ